MMRMTLYQYQLAISAVQAAYSKRADSLHQARHTGRDRELRALAMAMKRLGEARDRQFRHLERKRKAGPAGIPVPLSREARR